jgi:hypothetical protein
MTYLAPVAPTVPVPSCDPAPAILAVAEALQPDLAQGFQIDALRLRLEMERAFGGSDATGAWDWKLAYEAGEVALVLFLRKFGRALLARAGSPAALLPILAKVACLLPTHTRRSEEMERFKQFSTPLPMGLPGSSCSCFWLPGWRTACSAFGQCRGECLRAKCRRPRLHAARDGGRPRRGASVGRNLRDLPAAGDRHPRRGPTPDQARAVGGHGVRCAPETLLPPETPRRRLARRPAL